MTVTWGSPSAPATTSNDVARVSSLISCSWVRAAAWTASEPADGQRDAVGDVEAGVAAGLLDGADQVAGQPLGGQLRA